MESEKCSLAKPSNVIHKLPAPKKSDSLNNSASKNKRILNNSAEKKKDDNGKDLQQQDETNEDHEQFQMHMIQEIRYRVYKNILKMASSIYKTRQNNLFLKS